jgi:protein TonB
MNKIYFLLITFFSISCFAQEEMNVIDESPEVLSVRTVDVPPISNDCLGRDKKEKSNCFDEKMLQHIRKHFKYPNRAAEDDIQGKVIVSFIIDEKGKVIDIETIGGHKILQKEAYRIISLLPKFTPAKKEGKSVKIKYSIPINFKLR